MTAGYGLASAHAKARLLRIADGPDEVQRNQIARLELRQYDKTLSARGGNAFVAPLDEEAGLAERPRFIA